MVKRHHEVLEAGVARLKTFKPTHRDRGVIMGRRGTLAAANHLEQATSVLSVRPAATVASAVSDSLPPSLLPVLSRAQQQHDIFERDNTISVPALSAIAAEDGIRVVICPDSVDRFAKGVCVLVPMSHTTPILPSRNASQGPRRDGVFAAGSRHRAQPPGLPPSA